MQYGHWERLFLLKKTDDVAQNLTSLADKTVHQNWSNVINDTSLVSLHILSF